MAAHWVCTACHGPAHRRDNKVVCEDPYCGVVRILPALPERLPWESEG
ncbi:MAG: hypothetical protein WDA07_13230 [Leucobacter sp.]